MHAAASRRAGLLLRLRRRSPPCAGPAAAVAAQRVGWRRGRLLSTCWRQVAGRHTTNVRQQVWLLPVRTLFYS